MILIPKDDGRSASVSRNSGAETSGALRLTFAHAPHLLTSKHGVRQGAYEGGVKILRLVVFLIDSRRRIVLHGPRP